MKVTRVKLLIKIILILIPLTGFNQVKFSFATDASLLRNFDGKQPFTVFGQSVLLQWHLTELTTVYGFVSYHQNGKYKSTLRADAFQPTTQPQSFVFTNNSEMRLRHVSLGFKRYIKGNFRDFDFNIYGLAGFGLVVGAATNNFSMAVDTSLYKVQDNVLSGKGDFKRLSLDLGLGWEFPVEYEIYIYSEVRVLVPTTEYPSNYLLKNNNAPFLGTINLGVRILFDAED